MKRIVGVLSGEMSEALQSCVWGEGGIRISLLIFIVGQLGCQGKSESQILSTHVSFTHAYRPIFCLEDNDSC